MQIDEVELAVPALDLVVALEQALELVAQEARQVRVGEVAEALEPLQQRVAPLDHLGARHAVGELAAPLEPTPSQRGHQIDQSSLELVVVALRHRLHALHPARQRLGRIDRDAQPVARVAATARQLGQVLHRLDQRVDLGAQIDARPAPLGAQVTPFGQLEPGLHQPVERSEPAVGRLRRQAHQRAAQALGHLRQASPGSSR